MIKSAKTILKELQKETISKNNREESLAGLIIMGSLQFGSSKEGLKNLLNWIRPALPKYSELESKFNIMVNNLKESEVFKNGKVYMEKDTKNTNTEYIQLCLFICIAQGFIIRTLEKEK